MQNDPVLEFIYDVEDGNINAVRKYIADGGDVNAVINDFDDDFYSETALEVAVTHSSLQHLQIVKELIKAGADINHRHYYHGETPLMMAVYALVDGYGSEEIVKLLVDSGADVTIKSKSGKTAFDLCEGNFDCQQLVLLASGPSGPSGARASASRPPNRTVLPMMTPGAMVLQSTSRKDVNLIIKTDRELDFPAFLNVAKMSWKLCGVTQWENKYTGKLCQMTNPCNSPPPNSPECVEKDSMAISPNYIQIHVPKKAQIVALLTENTSSSIDKACPKLPTDKELRDFGLAGWQTQDLLALFETCFSQEVMKEIKAKIGQFPSSQALHQMYSAYLMFRPNAKVTGVLMGYPINSQSVYVDIICAQGGLTRHLLLEFMKWAKNAGYRFVHLSALCHVVNFYQKTLGFEIKLNPNAPPSYFQFPRPSDPLTPNWCPGYPHMDPNVKQVVNDLENAGYGNCSEGINMIADLSKLA